MRIAATADLDALQGNFETFWSALQKIENPDLFLWAGDMCDFRKIDEYSTIMRYIEQKKIKCPIVACFGNKEFDQDYDKIKKICGDKVMFLDDETLVTEINGKKIGIVGTKGCLDKPTFWQVRNIKNINEFYAKRFETVVQQLENLRKLVDVLILLIHYAPTHKTLKGEAPYIYGGLSYIKFEEAIKNIKPDIVIHGHAHSGIPFDFVDSIPIFNAAFPVNKKIVEINTEDLPKKGLRQFL